MVLAISWPHGGGEWHEGDFMRARIIDQLNEANFAPLNPLSALFGHGGHSPLSPLVPELIVRQVGEGVFIGFSPKAARLAALPGEGRDYTAHATEQQGRFIMAILRQGGVLAARDPHPNPPGTP